MSNSENKETRWELDCIDSVQGEHHYWTFDDQPHILHPDNANTFLRFTGQLDGHELMVRLDPNKLLYWTLTEMPSIYTRG